MGASLRTHTMQVTREMPAVQIRRKQSALMLRIAFLPFSLFRTQIQYQIIRAGVFCGRSASDLITMGIKFLLSVSDTMRRVFRRA